MSELTIRASRMPLAFACPGSVRPPALSLGGENYPARLGVAAHVLLRGLAESGTIDWGQAPDLAARYDVSIDEMRTLAAMAAKIWPTLAPSFPMALTEIPLAAQVVGVSGESYWITGHIDFVALGEKVARAGDWKTGRLDAYHAQQMRAYAALLLLEDPELVEATSTVVWIRDGEIESYTMRREALRPWLLELEERVVKWDGTYHPGAHCGFCPRSHECHAATAYVRRDVAAIADKLMVTRAETELSAMEPEQLIELHRKAVLVRGYAERVEGAIKRFVAENGPVQTADSRLYIETATRRELKPLAAWPILEAAGFTSEDFAECMDLRVSKVERRIAEKAGRGNGAAALRDLRDKLETADAVVTTETLLLKEKRA